MKKQEIFAQTVKIVTKVTEINEELIFSKCLREEVVDARHIVVKLLSESGLYVSEIADMTKICTRNLYKILTDFDNRLKCRKIFRINFENSLKEQRKDIELTLN